MNIPFSLQFAAETLQGVAKSWNNNLRAYGRDRAQLEFACTRAMRQLQDAITTLEGLERTAPKFGVDWQAALAAVGISDELIRDMRTVHAECAEAYADQYA